MTSETNDLEQELRQNLRLRRELASEVAKVKGAGFGYRLGWVLYGACLALAAAWVGGMLLIAGNGSVVEALNTLAGEPLFTALFLGLPALMLYGLGRAFRYFLSGV